MIARYLLPILLLAPLAPALSQQPASPALGLVDQPCLPLVPVPAILDAARVRSFDPSSRPPGAEVYGSPEVGRYFAALADRARTDWADLCHYRAANAAIAASGWTPKIVFIGDSITESWIAADPAFFGSDRLDRGISGQTSQQILARFYQDVVALHPTTVHILAGTNDAAGNLGPSRPQDVVANIAAMLDIAAANHIRVLLGAVPPAADFPWRPGMAPAARIVALNVELKALAAARRATFVDYHAALAGPDGGMRPGLASDGVHPNRAGYRIMDQLANAALRARPR